ncbi:hypothetical protein HPB50_023136 [Hyalomma asiaticum]|uniref:Uncharacterized protein n=1 Tax=Hyalomma asiaticum TaxID=266040 RepID=A0ACB7T2K4_HYAAI|nr:hypothetical protein HPB50_023136 [Hyalomma asiaticum]
MSKVLASRKALLQGLLPLQLPHLATLQPALVDLVVVDVFLVQCLAHVRDTELYSSRSNTRSRQRVDGFPVGVDVVHAFCSQARVLVHQLGVGRGTALGVVVTFTSVVGVLKAAAGDRYRRISTGQGRAVEGTQKRLSTDLDCDGCGG